MTSKKESNGIRFNTRSNETHEVLDKTPNWFIRQGITVIFVFIVGIISCTFWIKSNEVIFCSVTLFEGTPPIFVNSTRSGIIRDVFVENGEVIKEDEILAVLENSADIQDIYRLKKEIENHNHYLNDINSLGQVFPVELKLGEVYDEYHNFIKTYQNYIVTQGVSDKLSYQTSLDQSIQSLKYYLYNWELNHVFKSPKAGRVQMDESIRKNQLIKQNNVAFVIVPNNSSDLIGYISIASQDSEKVEVGQKVTIKLDDYPFQEWGTLNGEITNAPAISEGGSDFLAYIKVDELNTSKGKELSIKLEMTGQAEVVLGENTLFNRIIRIIAK